MDSEGNSEQVRRLHHHLILRHLDVEDDLHQWRRSIEQTHQSGESNSNKAHKEYLAHIYADRTPKDYERVKQALKKDLRHGRRWSILVDGFVADNGDSIPGLSLGLLLLCGPAVAKKKSYAHTFKKNLLICITVITLQDTLRMCEIMRSAAESLVHHGRLLDDHDFNAIAEDLGQCI